MLRRGAIEYLRITSTAGGLSLSVQNELANMESIERDAAGSEKLPRSLYTAFGALPLVGVIVTLVYLRALERVSSAHEKRWTAFVQQVSSACSKLSLGASLHPVGTARKDRFVPFCVAAIVFPPSLVVWYNVLIKDSIRHLESQAGEEDLLLQMFA